MALNQIVQCSQFGRVMLLMWRERKKEEKKLFNAIADKSKCRLRNSSLKLKLCKPVGSDGKREREIEIHNFVSETGNFLCDEITFWLFYRLS